MFKKSQDQASAKKSKSSKGDGEMTPAESFWDFFKTIFWAILIAIGIRTFAYEPFSIPSSSMVPTLLVGDYLFVSKFSYGYSRYSLPWGLPLISDRIMAEEQPVERGDVAVFKLPRDNRTDYIKRIIGLPGDRVQVTGGQLYLNGQAVPRERVEIGEVTDNGRRTQVTEFIETLPNGRKHRIWERSDSAPYDNTREFVVPEGHYFAMGDNRDNSEDSRSRYVGFIPKENLVGRAEILFFSLDGADMIEIWKWPTSLRFSRLLDRIE